VGLKDPEVPNTQEEQDLNGPEGPEQVCMEDTKGPNSSSNVDSGSNSNHILDFNPIFTISILIPSIAYNVFDDILRIM
jgi:hypothetical protein